MTMMESPFSKETLGGASGIAMLIPYLSRIAAIVASWEGLRQGIRPHALSLTSSGDITLRRIVQSPSNMESARANPKNVALLFIINHLSLQENFF